MIRLRSLGLMGVALTLACSTDSTGPKGSSIRGLRFVSGAGVTDTVATVLLQALVVEVHDSTGALAPTGTAVRFTAVMRPQGTSETLVEGLSSSVFGTFATSATDASGRAAVIVRLGTAAGPARLAISVPVFGLIDTARYIVTPGAAARVALAPADTLIYVGASYTFRGGVVDQYGNARADPVTWTTSTGGVSISGGVVSATTVGRYTITATSGTGTGSAAVSVAPRARLAGLRLTSPYGIGLADADGSNARLLTPVTDGGVGVHPMWMPGGASVVYAGLVGGTETLQIVDTTGTVRTFLQSVPLTVTHQADPAPTSDGQWVYFGAYDSRCVGYGYCLYRARVDGSAAELLGTAATSGSNLRPSPSPDGSRVAILVGSFGSSVIQIFDVASRTVLASTAGDFPAWSPDGTQIAFVAQFGGKLSVMKPDGTGLRAVNTRSYYSAQIGWTADSRFVVARGNLGTIELVDVTSGVAVPLPWSSTFLSASMK